MLYNTYNNCASSGYANFEWVRQQGQANRAKHGLDFATAARAFNDPLMILALDRLTGGETRWHAIGAVEQAVVLVVRVYIEDQESGEETILIIPARQANQRERRVYLQQAFE
jgi:uncharacterized protein